MGERTSKKRRSECDYCTCWYGRTSGCLHVVESIVELCLYVLVGNKTDMSTKRAVQTEEAELYASTTIHRTWRRQLILMFFFIFPYIQIYVCTAQNSLKLSSIYMSARMSLTLCG